MDSMFVFALVLILGQNFVDSRDTDPTVRSMGQSRVVGGKNATNSYPYQVSLDIPKTIGPRGKVYSWHHYCGGSIITTRHVLTAAFYTNNGLSILTGTNDLNNGGTRYFPLKNYTHPQYLTDKQVFDICIITIVGAFRFVPQKVQPIKYSSEETGAHVSCLLTGWGSTETYRIGPYPTYLQELKVLTISNKECQGTPSYSFISGTNICTLSGKGEGACSGDSGGPLVDIEKNVLVGIVEAVSGEGCANGNPDVFTRVSAFYDWIEKHTKMDLMTPNNMNPVKIFGK